MPKRAGATTWPVMGAVAKMGGAVDGVLLAAGRSRRAGTFKMEALLAGKPMLEWSLQTLAAVCERIIVVAGFEAEKVRRLAGGRPGVEVVVNEEYARGMLSSIQAGIRLVRAPRFFLLPGDMPMVEAGVCRQLLACGAEIVVPAHRGKTRPPGADLEPPDPRDTGRTGRFEPGAVHRPAGRGDHRRR